MKIKSVVIAAGLVALSSSAMAEVYVGVGGGLAHSNAATRLEGTYYHDATDEKDSNDAGYIAFGGYSFNQYLSVEADYIDFGSYKASLSYGGYAFAPSVDASGYSVAAVGTWPLGESFGLSGKIGAGKLTQTFHCGECNVPDNDHSSLVVVGGIGAYWNATKNLRVRVGYEHFGGGHFKAADSYGNEEKKSADFGLLYGGAELRF